MSDQQDTPKEEDPSPVIKKAKTTALNYKYCCEINVTFPTARHAHQVLQVLQVDQEIGERAIKTLCLCSSTDNGESEGDGGDNGGDDLRILNIRFQAAEAKILRVSVSSFYDYLTVSLKCLQEFDASLQC